MSHLEILEAELQEFQIEISNWEKALLVHYCDELARWNQKINLTGLHGAEMVRRLVVEPVWIGLRLKLSGILADIGSGNGSPAVPLHIVCHLEKTHLIEARSKRAAFLRNVASSLNLSGLIVHRVRFDEIASTLGPVDWITLQGVRLNPQIIETIRTNVPLTTNIVWITSVAEPPIPATHTLQVPLTATKVFVFRLDQS